MREIKFRAWDAEEKNFICFDALDGILSKCDETYRKRCVCKFEQFTGLYDKNGKEIYEGDIPDGYGAVFFSNEYLGYFAKSNEFECEYKPIYDIPIIEIIGNIHENPELLNDL